MRYANGKPEGIDAVVLSTQHKEDISLSELKEGVMEEIIKPTLPSHWIDETTKYFINPTGRFVTGGPQGDCGLTGRKIIVDTMAEWPDMAVALFQERILQGGSVRRIFSPLYSEESSRCQHCRTM